MSGASYAEGVPVSCWGKDHWSTLAFVAHWCAEHGAAGFDISQKRQQMRCDPKRHLAQSHIAWKEDCPTILRQGLRLPEHDDWDCLDDAEEAGLILLCGTGAFPVVFMTDTGLELAARLVAHKTRGGSFGDFEVAP